MRRRPELWARQIFSRLRPPIEPTAQTGHSRCSAVMRCDRPEAVFRVFSTQAVMLMPTLRFQGHLLADWIASIGDTITSAVSRASPHNR